MGFIALILSLMLEQLRPLTRANPVHALAARFAGAVAQSTDAGQRSHGVIAWSVVMGLALISVLALEWFLTWLHPMAVLAMHVVVLYFTMGFRQFSHAFTEIQIALAANDPQGAREALQRWVRSADPGFDASDLETSEVCRMAIARALVSAHRYVFGPLFWYMLLPGVLGPVLYRGAQFLAERWGESAAGAAGPAWLSRGATGAGSDAVSGAVLGAQQSQAFGQVAVTLYRWLDWVPSRLAAAGFAVMGNFEDAVYCWRTAASVKTGDVQRRLLLMAGSGALGVRIADPAMEAEVRAAQSAGSETESGPIASQPSGFDWHGIEPDAASLRSAVGLVWRALILWILLFAMLTIANWLGR